MLSIALFIAYILIRLTYNGPIYFANYSVGGKILTLISSYAWLAFMVMGAYWVFDKKLGRFIPITGTIAGSISILLSIAGILIMPVVLLLLIPLVKFAYHLASFHYANKASER